MFVRPRVSRGFKQFAARHFQLFEYPIYNRIEALVALEIREDKRPCTAHPASIAIHHIERSTDMWCEVRLINDQQIGPHNTRSAFAGNLISTGNIDDVNRGIRQIGAERGGKVVATAFYEDQVNIADRALEVGNRLEIHRAILAYGRVRAAACFYASHAFGGQGAHAYQELGVFARVYIVRYGGDTHPSRQAATQPRH
jgi:hypothetical protein